MNYIYEVVLPANTDTVTVDVPGFNPTLYKAIPSWGVNAIPPVGTPYISAQATDSVTISSNADSDNARALILVITGIDTEVAASMLTLTEVKRYLGIDLLDGTHDTILTAWIVGVTSELEERFHEKIVPVEITEYCDGGGYKLFPSSRIRSLVGNDESTRLGNLQYRDSATGTWANLLTDEDLIYLGSPHCVELLDGYYFPSGQKNIRIKYNGGFNPIPGDITEMAKQMIQIRWLESGQGGSLLGIISSGKNEGGGSSSKSTKDLEDRWQKVINRYRSQRQMGFSNESIHN